MRAGTALLTPRLQPGALFCRSKVNFIVSGGCQQGLESMGEAGGQLLPAHPPPPPAVLGLAVCGAAVQRAPARRACTCGCPALVAETRGLLPYISSNQPAPHPKLPPTSSAFPDLCRRVWPGGGPVLHDRLRNASQGGELPAPRTALPQPAAPHAARVAPSGNRTLMQHLPPHASPAGCTASVRPLAACPRTAPHPSNPAPPADPRQGVCHPGRPARHPVAVRRSSGHLHPHRGRPGRQPHPRQLRLLLDHLVSRCWCGVCFSRCSVAGRRACCMPAAPRWSTPTSRPSWPTPLMPCPSLPHPWPQCAVGLVPCHFRARSGKFGEIRCTQCL